MRQSLHTDQQVCRQILRSIPAGADSTRRSLQKSPAQPWGCCSSSSGGAQQSAAETQGWSLLWSDAVSRWVIQPAAQYCQAPAEIWVRQEVFKNRGAGTTCRMDRRHLPTTPGR